MTFLLYRKICAPHHHCRFNWEKVELCSCIYPFYIINFHMHSFLYLEYHLYLYACALYYLALLKLLLFSFHELLSTFKISFLFQIYALCS